MDDILQESNTRPKSAPALEASHSDHILNLSQNHQSVHSSLEDPIDETALLISPKPRPLTAPRAPSESGSLLGRGGSRGRTYGALDTEEGCSDTDRLIPTEADGLDARSDLRLRNVSTDSGVNTPTEGVVSPKGRLCQYWALLTSDTSKAALNNVKIALLFIATLICTGIFALHPEFNYYNHHYSISIFSPQRLNATGISSAYPIVSLFLEGPFVIAVPSKKTQNVTVEATNPVTGTVKRAQWAVASKDELGYIEQSTVDNRFDFSDEELGSYVLLDVKASTVYSVPVTVGYIFQSTQIYNEVIYATIILFFVYVLIIFDLVHRALAAMLGSLAALAVLAVLNLKPSLEEVLTWLDYDTLCLLFGMMLLVSIFCETGFFDWLALQSYKVAKGKTWPLITILCLFSAVTSAFLDNVTTILLMAPVTIRLCEVMELDPKHILMAEVLFSNIGGTATAIGDPPNVIIVGSSGIETASEGTINFATFTLHMAVGSVFTTIAAYILLRFMYRRKELLKNTDPPHIFELKVEIAIWKRSMNRIAVASREGAMVKMLLHQKVRDMQTLLREKRQEIKYAMVEDFKTQLVELEKKYVVQDKWLLAKCGFVITFVIVIFFIHSFIPKIDVSIGWIAMLGAIWLLVLSDNADLESVLHRIEWATLLFFAALFVLMEGLTRLNLMDFIATQASDLIKLVDEDNRLTVAIIVIVWISAIASSFIDNIPFTTAMVPVIVKMADDPSLGLPLAPLVFSLAFGACLGGNGTLIGASANVVCAGLAEANGHAFSFWEFFKVGFPTMLVTVFIAMCYLLICHVAFDWNL